MGLIYKIEICLYPNNQYDSSKPFFWCIQSNAGKNWCTDCAGWEKSEKAAWDAAFSHYQKYKHKSPNTDARNSL